MLLTREDLMTNPREISSHPGSYALIVDRCSLAVRILRMGVGDNFPMKMPLNYPFHVYIVNLKTTKAHAKMPLNYPVLFFDGEAG